MSLKEVKQKDVKQIALRFGSAQGPGGEEHAANGLAAASRQARFSGPNDFTRFRRQFVRFSHTNHAATKEKHHATDQG
jgi:hypothetical protein